MKYLLSKLLSTEDAVKFMYEHDEAEEIVPEHLLEGCILAAVIQETCKARKTGVFKTFDTRNGIVNVVTDDIDAIVCYPDDANRYSRFGKKIIAVGNSEG